MKQILFTLLLFCVAGLYSCRKSTNDLNIKQFDDQQIQAYISANGLTGMQRDPSGGDTTGIYYKILSQGTGKVVDYPDMVSLVFTVRSFDGQFIAADTIVNHVYNFLGHINRNNLPSGVELAIINLLKNKGTRARVLVPSHLAYGSTGFGTGSSDGNNRIKGNQCLDYYIDLVDDQAKYDDLSVKNYIAANNLTGYTKTASGLWYKVLQTGAGAAIGANAVVTVQYTSYLFNGFMTSDQVNTTDGTIIDLGNDTRAGLIEGLQLTTPGAKLSLIMPSRMVYGTNAYGDQTIPINSCLRYDMNVISVQ
ncbi:MAG: FKBP-type peptidyl-prolyl cis-trans isomerase [Bacteroidota bacterium]